MRILAEELFVLFICGLVLLNLFAPSVWKFLAVLIYRVLNY